MGCKWVAPLKIKKGFTFNNAFQKLLDDQSKKKYEWIRVANFTIDH